MMELRMSEVATCLDGILFGVDARVRGVCIDSRRIRGGELFVALPGSRVDGHDYLAAAARAGAGGALVARVGEVGLAQVRVADPEQALGRLASVWRGRLDPGLVGVTGSNGKTTVKQMLARVLGGFGPTLATRGNLNNQLGVPLMLAELGPEHRFAVIEMGANHAGEIAYLGRLARPRVAVITNAGAAHLEGFGSLEGVAAAKGEIIDALGPDGVAVLNADDRFCADWVSRAGARRVLRFGLGPDAEVRMVDAVGGGAEIHWGDQALPFRPALPGRHNLYNAAAAFAAALALDLDPRAVVEALEDVAPVAGRLAARPGLNGSLVVDDSYNANPESLRAGVDWAVAGGGRAWLVLGDMAELGPESDRIHAEMGRYAAATGVERMFGFGPGSRLAAQAFGAGGTGFDDLDELLAAVRAGLEPGVKVLVKGSRRMGMERVVTGLVVSTEEAS